MIDHLGDIYFWTVFYAFCKIEGLSCKLFKILWYPLKFFCRYLKFIYIFFTIFWESNNFWVWPTFVSVLHSNITGLKIFVFFPLPIYKKKMQCFIISFIFFLGQVLLLHFFLIISILSYTYFTVFNPKILWECLNFIHIYHLLVIFFSNSLLFLRRNNLLKSFYQAYKISLALISKIEKFIRNL